MPGNYSHTTRSTGTVLTAAIYNGDHQNHIDNFTPQGCDDYSQINTQMRSEVAPWVSGAESLATSGAGELERLRYILNQIKTGNAVGAYWYHPNHGQGDPLFAESFGI